jgi:hypothetical protein
MRDKDTSHILVVSKDSKEPIGIVTVGSLKGGKIVLISD